MNRGPGNLYFFSPKNYSDQFKSTFLSLFQSSISANLYKIREPLLNVRMEKVGKYHFGLFDYMLNFSGTNSFFDIGSFR